MSRMIPPFFEDTNTSQGEAKLFRALQILPDDYTVLHSLGLASHRSKVFSEIDFVVIGKEGILCLEVKGGRVYRKEGIWYFVDRNDKEHKNVEGPFKQVIGATFSLRDHLLKKFGYGHPCCSCLFASGVAFPDIPFTQKGPEIILEIVYDIRNFESEIRKYIQDVFSYWRKQTLEKHGFEPGTLDRNQIEKLTDYLRGDFGYVTSLDYIVDRTDKNLLRLTQEQIDRLSMASDNPRILLTGGAGTGKTLLSLEYAKRAVLTGKKVLYLCFNRKLSQYLAYQLSKAETNMLSNLTVRHFHGVLTDILDKIGYLPNQGTNASEYFEMTLPEAFFDLGQSGAIEQYDVLVIDEGQDLIRYEYLMCMDLLLKDGLKDGNWYICFDPFQNIYNPKIEEGMEILKNINHTRLNLDTNCRNTRPIGIYTTLLTGIPPAKRFKVDGLRVERESYADQTEQRLRVIKRVKNLLGQGVKPGAIYLLSSRSFENSCLQGENIFNSICSFQNITATDPKFVMDNSVKFCTVQSFKGLEAQIVILLDVEGFLNENTRLVNYVAMSRAKSLLYIYYQEDCEEEINTISRDSAKYLEVLEG